MTGPKDTRSGPDLQAHPYFLRERHLQWKPRADLVWVFVSQQTVT